MTVLGMVELSKSPETANPNSMPSAGLGGFIIHQGISYKQQCRVGMGSGGGRYVFSFQMLQ